MEADGDFIKSISWCRDLLGSPNVTIVPTPSRKIKESTEDALFSEALKDKDTVRDCLTFHDRPESDSALIHQVNMIVSLGHKVNGYPHVTHGGMVAVLFDEVMGTLLALNKRRVAIPGVESSVTANLNVTFLLPVATPQTVILSAVFKKIEGRKIFIGATLKDSAGVAHAKAEALWISLKEKL